VETTWNTGATESYNGTSWTNVNIIKHCKSWSRWSRIQTLAYMFWRICWDLQEYRSTELWNGTSMDNNPTGLATAESNELNWWNRNSSFCFSCRWFPGPSGLLQVQQKNGMEQAFSN
jgi:hypothetical protein